MLKSPTQEQIEFYRENGFVTVEGFLSSDELERWRRAVDDAILERKGAVFSSRDDLVDDPDNQSYYSKVFTQRVNLWQTNEAIRALVLDPELGRFVAELSGLDGVRIWHDQALVKQPWANPTGLHLDVPYWSFMSHDVTSAWVALDDATLTNGCLCYIPGSHRAQRYDNVGIGPELGAIFEVYPEWRQIDPVFCPVKAGGVVFHNGLTAHGAGANMTHGRRRAMTAGFTPLQIRFNGVQNILTDEQVAGLAVGDLIDLPDQNPVVWSRAGHPVA